MCAPHFAGRFASFDRSLRSTIERTSYYIANSRLFVDTYGWKNKKKLRRRLQLVIINMWPPAFFLLIHITWFSIFHPPNLWCCTHQFFGWIIFHLHHWKQRSSAARKKGIIYIDGEQVMPTVNSEVREKKQSVVKRYFFSACFMVM